MAFGAQIKLSVDSSGRSKNEFRGQIQQLVDQISASNPVKLKTLKIELSQQSKQQLAQQIQSGIASKNYSIETITIKKIDASSAVENLRRQLQTMLSGLSITGLKEFLGDTASSTALDKATAAANKLAEAQDNVKKKTEESAAAARELSALQSSLNSSYKKSFDVGNAGMATELAEAYRELTLQIERAKTAEGDEQQAAVSSISETVRMYKQKVDVILEVQKEAGKLAEAEIKAAQRSAAEAEKAAEKKVIYERQSLQLQQQITEYIANNPRAYKVYGAQIDALFNSLRSGGENLGNVLNVVKRDFADIKVQADAAGLSGRTFMQRLTEGWEKFGGWNLVTKSMTMVTQKLKEAYQAVKDVDAAMTELRKVTDLTAEGYDRVYQNAAKTAQAIGATVSDTINSTADFARLGFSVEDSAELARVSLIYKNVGDGIENISDATESLISTIKAFGIEARDAIHIVDAFNEVGRHNCPVTQQCAI